MRVGWTYVLLVIILLALGALACDLSGGGKPTVVINSPPSNYEIGEGEELAVDVLAKGGGNIDRVELSVDNALVNVATSPAPQQSFNAQLTWGASGVGQHTVQVRAYNTGGQASDLAVILVVVVTQGVAVATATGEVGPSATATATATPEEEATATPTNTPAPPTPTPTVTPTLAPACPGPPVIASFYANPSTITPGGSSILSWGPVTNATSVSIDQGIGGVGTPGSKVVTPATTTSYTMTATGCGGTVTSQATIIVNAAVHSQGEETIPPGNFFDLDEGKFNAPGADFEWYRIEPSKWGFFGYSLRPGNGAVYANMGRHADLGAVSRSVCEIALYSGAEIQNYGVDKNAYLGVTTMLCYRTSDGRLGKLQVLGFAGPNTMTKLEIWWMTWN